MGGARGIIDSANDLEFVMNKTELFELNGYYSSGYLDALSDVLGVLGDMGETAEIYKLKELVRNALRKEEWLEK